MSSHRIPPGELSDRIAKLKKKVGAALDAREKRLAKAKEPQLPSFTKKIREEKDHEHSMARSELHKIDNALKILRNKLKGEGNLEAWVQSKITRAADYLDAASNYIDSGEHNGQVDESFDDVPEMRSRTVTNSSSSTSSTKKPRKSPGELMRMLNQDTPKPKKKKKVKVAEETMTPEDKAKEKKLKAKYDDSEMKQNMIDQYGEEKGTQIYFAKIRKMAIEEIQEVEDYLEERKLSRTARRSARVGKPGYDAEGKPKPKGKVRAWDMDETLMRNDPKKIRVHVKDKEGKKVQSLTNQEFNTHKLDKDKGHSYDFGEFRSSEKFSKASTPNKSMVKKLKKQVKRGKPVHIVTARGSFDDQPKFAKHLRRHGIEIDPGKGKGGRHIHVHRAGDMEGSDIGEKKVKIVKGLMKKHGTSGAEMYDDAAKVHRAFKKSARQTPTQPKVKTKMVQPNKKDTTQARSFKEEIDLDLIYDFILEQLIVEGYVESHDEAASLVEEFSDELLDDLIQESYEMIEDILTEEEEEEEVEMVEERELKIDYVSPYKKLQEKKEIKEKYMVEETEMTPYEYWKSFIGEEDEEISEEVVSEEDLDEDYIEEEVPMNSYQKWKMYLGEAPYTGRAVGRDAMVASNIARGSRPTPTSGASTPSSTSSSTSGGPGALEKLGSSVGSKVGGLIGYNKGKSTGIPGAGTIGRTIGSNRGSTIGGNLGKAADSVVGGLTKTASSTPKPTSTASKPSGGYSTRPGDGKPYKDGPLWDGPEKKTSKPSGGYSTREGDGKLRKEPLW